MVYKGDKLLLHCSAGSKSSVSCLMKVAISFQDGAMSLCLLKGYMSSYSGLDKASTSRSPFYKSFNPVGKGESQSPSTRSLLSILLLSPSVNVGWIMLLLEFVLCKNYVFPKLQKRWGFRGVIGLCRFLWYETKPFIKKAFYKAWHTGPSPFLNLRPHCSSALKDGVTSAILEELRSIHQTTRSASILTLLFLTPELQGKRNLFKQLPFQTILSWPHTWTRRGQGFQKHSDTPLFPMHWMSQVCLLEEVIRNTTHFISHSMKMESSQAKHFWCLAKFSSI